MCQGPDIIAANYPRENYHRNIGSNLGHVHISTPQTCYIFLPKRSSLQAKLEIGGGVRINGNTIEREEGECGDWEGWTSNYDRKYAVKCLPKIQISEAAEIENKYKMISEL